MPSYVLLTDVDTLTKRTERKKERERKRDRGIIVT